MDVYISHGLIMLLHTSERSKGDEADGRYEVASTDHGSEVVKFDYLSHIKVGKAVVGAQCSSKHCHYNNQSRTRGLEWDNCLG